MRLVQQIPLEAQNSHLVSIAATINFRLRYFCFFSDFQINGVQAPRLPQILFYGENNQEYFIDYSCFSLSFSLKKKNKDSLFSLRKKMSTKFSSMVVIKNDKNYRIFFLFFYLYQLLGFPSTNWTVILPFQLVEPFYNKIVKFF